jgi:hypothetical protein
VALVGLNSQEVLATLDRVTSELDEANHNINITRSGILVVREGAVNIDTINDSVGETQESELDIVLQVFIISHVHGDGEGGEGLVALRLEGKSECLAVLITSSVSNTILGVLNEVEDDFLSVDVLVSEKVISHIKDISAVGADTLGAVNIAIGGIADASTGLVVVPVTESESLGGLLDRLVRELSTRRGVSQILNVLAGAVARAVVGAGGALAALALIAIEASALASLAVADTTAGALKVLVEVALTVGGVDPGDLEGADALRAVTGVVGEADAPVVVALAHVVGGAVTVARALVVAGSVNNANEGEDQSDREKHCK